MFETETRMPKATKSSALGAIPEQTHEEMTTSSQDEHSSSDQEPDPEITFQPLDSHNQSQACSCHILRVPRWTEKLMMGFTIDF